MRDTLGVLLAGGAGERLFPLTRDRAKPAVPFAGQYRIIDITLSNCINSDLRHVYIPVSYTHLIGRAVGAENHGHPLDTPYIMKINQEDRAASGRALHGTGLGRVGNRSLTIQTAAEPGIYP